MQLVSAEAAKRGVVVSLAGPDGALRCTTRDRKACAEDSVGAVQPAGKGMEQKGISGSKGGDNRPPRIASVSPRSIRCRLGRRAESWFVAKQGAGGKALKLFAQLKQINPASLAQLCGIAYDTSVSRRRIVLDTNVLVSGLRSRRGASYRLLSLLGTSLFEPCISVPLMFEYEDVLSRASLALRKSAVDDVLNYLCSVAHLQEVHFLWRPLLKDPKDDLVLEVGVASQSYAVITFNLGDFVPTRQFGLKALTPGQFLEEIGVKS